MRTLYENFPELSEDACHFRLTDQSVTAVTVRLAGTVGAERSPLPADETVCPLKSSIAVNANAAEKTMRREICRVVMLDLLNPDEVVFRLVPQRIHRHHSNTDVRYPRWTMKFLQRARKGKRRLSELWTVEYYYSDVSSLSFCDATLVYISSSTKVGVASST